ncbi:ABC transporter substrate-binding protein [Agrobacterium tumefaciens]|uniref:ABC transporter substrate-binding protein n=1 Tax=Agrobacterium tumefaciens TaxID=358 RepID=UPI003F7BE830
MKVLLSCAAVVGTISMPAVAQDAGPIKIGVLTDVSGQFSHEAGDGSIAAVKMAVEDFGGKVLDRRLEVLVADHQNKPEVAVSTAREWYESQGVAMINNLINSGIALAVTEVAKDEDKIAIVNGSGSSRLTNDSCTPNSIHYSYDTYALANGTANELIRQGLKNWFFLTADYAFGQALEADATQIVKANGGTVSGAVRYPIETSDHSAFMLQAQASPAQVVAMAGSGTTFVNAVKSASEFGLASSGKTVAGLLVWDTDVHSLGLETAQGMILTNAFYWDRNDETRAFAKKFEARVGRPPHMGDAGDYSSTTHYLNAVKAVGSTDTKQVMAKMREMPINDFFATNGKIREDGRMVHDMYVYQVKTPAESKSEWDLLKLVTTIPGDKAFRPLSDSKCPLVKK